jgi:hypothetical protein
MQPDVSGNGPDAVSGKNVVRLLSLVYALRVRKNPPVSVGACFSQESLIIQHFVYAGGRRDCSAD